MKAFTIYQPYAYAIVAGLKGYETRPRRTHIRGRVAVHAGKGNPQFVSMPVSIALPESAVLHYGAAESTERENTPEPEKYPETRCVDEGICPYCKERFNAAQAVNYSTQGTQGIGPVDCPHCGRPINIFCSVEYLCSVPEGGETK